MARLNSTQQMLMIGREKSKLLADMFLKFTVENNSHQENVADDTQKGKQNHQSMRQGPSSAAKTAKMHYDIPLKERFFNQCDKVMVLYPIETKTRRTRNVLHA